MGVVIRGRAVATTWRERAGREGVAGAELGGTRREAAVLVVNDTVAGVLAGVVAGVVAGVGSRNNHCWKIALARRLLGREVAFKSSTSSRRSSRSDIPRAVFSNSCRASWRVSERRVA